MKVKPELQEEYNKYVSNNQDPYGKEVIEYSERWANLLEEKLENSPDATVRNILQLNADTLSHKANINGITGFMYGCAVQGLARFWIYGEELRKWHNGEYGVSEEAKGVVNPAVIVIGD